MKLITDQDDDLRMTQEQKLLLDKSNGRILLFYLSSPMTFGLSKAIAREHNAMKESDALVIVGASDKIQGRSQRFGPGRSGQPSLSLINPAM